jgi:predicted dehydrogenase
MAFFPRFHYFFRVNIFLQNPARYKIYFKKITGQYYRYKNDGKDGAKAGRKHAAAKRGKKEIPAERPTGHFSLTAAPGSRKTGRHAFPLRALALPLQKRSIQQPPMTENTTIRWGFIGCGEVTEKKSGPAFSAVPGSSVVAVMSRSKEKARSYAERHHIPRWYNDAQQLVDDPDVNAVYIATPPSTHATYAIMAMKSGKAVYIEKPMASNYEDCCRINRIAEKTHVPCFVAYYRRYLPYFQKVKELVNNGSIGNVINVQIRFAVPPRDLDYNSTNLPWRVQPDIAGGGYFYDLAPHQIDLLQQMFGPIIEAEGYRANRGGLYATEDTVSACFRFADGLPGSGSWCFVGHESAKEDCIEIIGDKGLLSFSVFTYTPIVLHTEKGREEITLSNPPYVQLPLIRLVVEHLQDKAICHCDNISATSVNWVVDRILGKI